MKLSKSCLGLCFVTATELAEMAGREFAWLANGCHVLDWMPKDEFSYLISFDLQYLFSTGFPPAHDIHC